MFIIIMFTGRRREAQPAGIVFIRGQIFVFFAPQGRHVAPIKVKFGREERTLQNLTSIGSGVWVYGPNNFENLEFYQYNCP